MNPRGTEPKRRPGRPPSAYQGAAYTVELDEADREKLMRVADHMNKSQAETIRALIRKADAEIVEPGQ